MALHPFTLPESIEVIYPLAPKNIGCEIEAGSGERVVFDCWESQIPAFSRLRQINEHETRGRHVDVEDLRDSTRPLTGLDCGQGETGELACSPSVHAI